VEEHGDRPLPRDKEQRADERTFPDVSPGDRDLRQHLIGDPEDQCRDAERHERTGELQRPTEVRHERVVRKERHRNGDERIRRKGDDQERRHNENHHERSEPFPYDLADRLIFLHLDMPDDIEGVLQRQEDARRGAKECQPADEPESVLVCTFARADRTMACSAVAAS